MAVIIYSRTSTTKQELGHQAQIDACTRWAESQNLQIKAIFSDTITGSKSLEQREGLPAAISSLSAGDVLAIYRRDRLGRDVINNAVCERLIKRKGANLYSLDVGSNESAESQILGQLLDVRLVKKARRVEMIYLASTDVYTKRPIQEAIERTG